jgi:Raf kinase inhibitor-like YbhB/YbcL family protein
MMSAMARLAVWSVALAAVVPAIAGCGGGDNVSSAPAAPAARMSVSSPAFAPGATIPTRYTCKGAGARPALRFGGAPDGAAELALLVIDPDAGGFVHWTVYGMAPSVRGIGSTGLPAGAREGRNSGGATGWTPPCPPSGRHRYEFELYALRDRSGLDAGAAPQDVVDAIRSRAAARGELIGRFGPG